ncbi:ABC transporter substrate-binding protein [Desulfocastanea catecholica]
MATDQKTIKQRAYASRFFFVVIAVQLVLLLAGGCSDERSSTTPTLNWYVFDEPSGAFVEAARTCSRQSAGQYIIALIPLPTDADQQREQLVRRLAARDSDIDILGMDVIWTAEFAAAGWIETWPADLADRVTKGRLDSAVESATYDGHLQAAPFTTNTQLLWYRTDRITSPPKTWSETIAMAEALGEKGIIQVQGERYEGLTVFFNSLLASAGGSILAGDKVLPDDVATRKALGVMQRLALSPAAPASLATHREDQCRLAFEAGDSSFMVNYTFVWPSAGQNAPDVAKHMGWARWPAVSPDKPSRVTIGGINLGIGAYTRHPQAAFAAASCLVSESNQRLAAAKGGLPPTIIALYQDSKVRATFPFADILLETLKSGVQRPQTPLYNDISLAISHTLHPMRSIDPLEDVRRLREKIDRALRSEGLL